MEVGDGEGGGGGGARCRGKGNSRIRGGLIKKMVFRNWAALTYT